jgi:hypothetical protein
MTIIRATTQDPPAARDELCHPFNDIKRAVVSEGPANMAATDIILRFSYSTGSNSDMRTFKVYQLIEAEGSTNELELYRVSLHADDIHASSFSYS